MSKILVIDDEAGFRNLLETLLRLKGYTVVLGIPDRVRHRGIWIRRLREAPVIVDYRLTEHPSAIDTTVHHEAAFRRHEVETPGRPAALWTWPHAGLL